jgi:hypothetical protein
MKRGYKPLVLDAIWSFISFSILPVFSEACLANLFTHVFCFVCNKLARFKNGYILSQFLILSRKVRKLLK